MELYLDKAPERDDFFKTAAFAARLSDKPENWPQELTSELLRQLPFLSDYDLNVNLQTVEPQRGFAFGYADVATKTERPESEHAESGVPHIRIPLVIKERAVKPFSVFLDGEKVVPLTEDRIRQTLFNPQTFDMSSSVPRDPSLVEPLMPPQRTGPGMGGEYKVASVLHAIAPTIRESDSRSFVEKVASDPDLVAGFRRSGVAKGLVSVFDNVKTASADERLATLAERIQPTAVTVLKLPGGDFLVKSANVNAFAGDQEAKGKVVPGQEAEKAIGPKNAQNMQPGQSATGVAEPVEPVQEEKPNEKVIEEFGEYLVQDQMGNSLMGWVIPETIAWDGQFSPQPIALFTNGSAYAFQDVIAGELVGKSTTLPIDAPRGDGVFYSSQHGKVVATQPITIGSAATGPDGQPKFIGTDSFGNQVQVGFAEGLKEPMRVSDVEYALPDNWKFMRLNNQTHLASDPGEMNKVAMAKAEATSVTVVYNGGYHLRGGCGLDKIASEFKSDLDPVSTEFMLGVLGLNGTAAKAKVAEARRNGYVKIAGLKTITTLAERYHQAEKVASALISKIPNLRKDLIKEAAQLDDESTVNNVLSLNFINPENLSTFIGYIPELEQTSEKLAEMWLYSVIGMNQLPEGALTSAMNGMEEVLEGLKSIAHSEA